MILLFLNNHKCSFSCPVADSSVGYGFHSCSLVRTFEKNSKNFEF